MLVTIIRAAILYVFIVLSLRVMGKRQLSDLQPSELVVTLIVADIASIPMQDVSKPLLMGLLPMLILVSLEISVSVLMMKNSKFRRIVCGSPVMIIEDGQLLQDKMKSLRITTEDLCVQLRQFGVFSLDDVQYCIAETNGKLSVLQKPPKRNPTAEDFRLETPDKGIETVVISDGKFLDNSIRLASTSEEEISKILKKNNISAEKVFLMTFNRVGDYKIIEKE